MRGKARFALTVAAMLALPGTASDAGLAVYNPENTAIVVFTGHNKRLAAGMDIYRRGDARHIFVTGVDLQNEETINLVDGLSKDSLDKNAMNTAENGLAVHAWLKDKQITRVILVTSKFHMGRSRLVLARNLDPGICILPHPVEDPAALTIAGQRWEYLKHLATQLGISRIPGVQLSI